MNERGLSKKLRFESKTQGSLTEGITSGQVGPKSAPTPQGVKKRRLLFEEDKPKDSAFITDDAAPYGLPPPPHKEKSRLRFEDEDSSGELSHATTEAEPVTPTTPGTSGQLGPKLKQQSDLRQGDKNSIQAEHLHPDGDSSPLQHDDEAPAFQHDDGFTTPGDSGGSSAPKGKAPGTDGNPKTNTKTAQDTKHLEKSKLRVDNAEAKLGKAQEKLAAQEPIQKPGIVKRLGNKAKFATWAYVHKKIHQVEHENVGTEAAHKTELAAEGAYRSTSRYVKRRIRNRPARRVQKLTKKTAKARANHAYRQLLHDNPALKKKTLARLYHKQRLKMQYAKQARQGLQGAKQGGTLIAKAAAKLKTIAIALVKGNPKVWIVFLLLFLLIVILQSCVALVTSVGSGMGGVAVGTSYLAEDEEITAATVLYTEWETDLHYRIIHAERDHPDYDEYRFDIGGISHNPFELVAFLTAVYDDFTLAEVQATLYEIFNEQYQLEFISEVEIRTRTEERTGSGSWTDSEGNEHSYTYTYTVIVEYEWHILNVNLTSQSFTSVIMPLMDEEQAERFQVLMLTKGNRQYLHSPFDFNWLPFVSSLYGWRIHPITGERSFHWGLDIALPEGTPILSGQDGTVIFAAYSGGYGFLVVIDNGEGLVSRYAHCSIIYVTVGQEVSVGDVIARVGSTGQSTGPHLHLEIIKNGRHLNPLIFTVTNHHLGL